MRNAAIAQTRELLNHNKLGGLSSRRIRTPSSETAESHRRASAPTSAVSEEEAEEGVVRRNSTRGGDLPPLGRRDADALRRGSCIIMCTCG